MPQILKADQESNDKVYGEGLHEFETAAPMGAAWPSGLTVNLDIRSPIPGEETVWKTLHTFSSESSLQRYLVRGRIYRVVASTSGVWMWLNNLVDNTIDPRAR